MSVCKGGIGSSTKAAGAAAGEGKENNGGRSHLFSAPSPGKAKAAGDGVKNGGGGGGRKEDPGAGKSEDNAFDLMPPPLPRTPGKGKGAQTRSSVLSPLGRHDPNLRQPASRTDSSAGSGDGSDGGGVGRGRAAQKVGSVGACGSTAFFSPLTSSFAVRRGPFFALQPGRILLLLQVRLLSSNTCNHA